jgi:hypothetical protein
MKHVMISSVALFATGCGVAAPVDESSSALSGATCINDGAPYYAILEAGGQLALGGAAVTMAASTLTPSDPSATVSHELWYFTDSDLDHWVEVGVMASPSGHGVFWGENKASGYTRHFSKLAWSLNVYYQAEVVWTGQSCAWSASFNDVNLGTSTGNCGGTYRSMSAGLESSNTSSNTHVGGNLVGWEQKGNNGWEYGWGSPGSILYSDCPAAIQYTDAYDNETEEKLHGPF